MTRNSGELLARDATFGDGFCRVPQIEVPYQAMQIVGMHAEQARRFRVISLRFLQRRQDQLFLCLFDRGMVFGGSNSGHVPFQDGLRQIFGLNDLRKTQNQSPLDPAHCPASRSSLNMPWLREKSAWA